MICLFCSAGVNDDSFCVRSYWLVVFIFLVLLICLCPFLCPSGAFNFVFFYFLVLLCLLLWCFGLFLYFFRCCCDLFCVDSASYLLFSGAIGWVVFWCFFGLFVFLFAPKSQGKYGQNCTWIDQRWKSNVAFVPSFLLKSFDELRVPSLFIATFLYLLAGVEQERLLQ